ILADRRMLGSPEGRIALAGAVAIDAFTWPLLAIALGLAAGGGTGALQALAGLGAGGAICLALRRSLALAWPTGPSADHPSAAALVRGIAAIAAAAATEHYRLTVVVGAVLIGLAVPRRGPGSPWDRAVGLVATTGRWLVPVYFTTTGLTLLAGRVHPLAW